MIEFFFEDFWGGVRRIVILCVKRIIRGVVVFKIKV